MPKLPRCRGACRYKMGRRPVTSLAIMGSLVPSISPSRLRAALSDWRQSAAAYFILMLAARITLAHFSVSSRMNSPNSAGELENTAAPRSANRALSLGSARPALISLLSFSTISAGVRRTRPPHRAQSLDGGYAEVANRLSIGKATGLHHQYVRI